MSRIRANKITNKLGTGAVEFEKGAHLPVGMGITGAGSLNITGVITATTISATTFAGVDATALKDPAGNVKVQAQASGAVYTGIHTFNSDIDVDGHTNLDNVNVVGILTVTRSGSNTAAVFSGGGGAGTINIQDGDDGTLAMISVDGGNLKLKTSGGSYSDKFTVATGGDVTVNTGNLVIGTSGKGIDFSISAGPTNGTTTQDSELLDDYEEGKITFESNNSGLTINTSFKGRYTKIGELVTVSGYIDVSSVTSSSAILQVKMPFTSAANSEGYYTRGVGATFARQMNFPSNYHNMVAYVGGGESYMRFFMTRNAGGSADWHQMVHSNLTSSSSIYFNVCYTTTS